MKIGVTSQNFKTITGHAGKTRRFMVFENEDTKLPQLIKKLDLPKEMSMHAFQGDHHPLDELDVLITGSCGQGFINKMSKKGVKVITTSEKSINAAVGKVAMGLPLTPQLNHVH